MEAVINKRFGMHVRGLRKETGLTLRELSKRVCDRLQDKSSRKLDHAYLSRIERGVKNPPSDMIVEALAKELQYSADELLWLAGRVPANMIDYVSDNMGAFRFLKYACWQNMSDWDWQCLKEIHIAMHRWMMSEYQDQDQNQES